MSVLPLTGSVSWVSYPSLCCMRKLSCAISCGAFGSLETRKGKPGADRAAWLMG